MKIPAIIPAGLLFAAVVAAPAQGKPSPHLSAPARTTWMADNGNGTYTNPLFYDEFSDPDLIRVGDDYYLTGTTMHSMPGLPVLHSRDLVNWTFMGDASGGLDFSPACRLQDGKNIYGQGIWAPSFRYHDGVFYIFSNVNGRTTHLYTATNPAGPWRHRELKRAFHDLSVLFDDDGKVYVVWGYQDLRIAEFDQNFDVIPGTEHVLFAKNDGMGEGSHFYKINGKYYIISAWWDGRMRMACARADHPDGPYEVNPEICADEDFGMPMGNRLVHPWGGSFAFTPRQPHSVGHLSLHQGGIVETQKGAWWGFSMMDDNSVGRVTCLSPVTWKDGWPYFGLPGNLERVPRTWVKPDTGFVSAPTAPYQRNDDFGGPRLANVWQWNHFPASGQWSLTERPGYLRLHALPAHNLWDARDTLTQRAIGPESIPTAELDTAGMQPGDRAGLALFNYPYAWIGIARTPAGYELRQFDQRTGKTTTAPFAGGRIWLRARCNFLTEKATFSYSTDGRDFRPFGTGFTMIYQLKTFQGVRYSLFSFNVTGTRGGDADFDRFTVDEPHPYGFTRPIPAGRIIILENLLDGSVLEATGDRLASVPKTDAPAARFKVVGLPLGRVALATAAGLRVTVTGPGMTDRVCLRPAQPDGSPAQTFQWIETPYGDVLLLSLGTDRYLRIWPYQGAITANARGAFFDHRNGASFTFRVMP